MKTHFTPWQYLPSALKELLPISLVEVINEQCHQVNLLSDGLSNQNFHIVLSNKDSNGTGHDSETNSDWVLRANQDNAKWCDRDNEVSSWKLIETINRAPELIWVSEDKQFYLSKFVNESKRIPILDSMSKPFNKPNAKWAAFYGEYCFADPSRPQASMFGNYEPVSYLYNLLKPLSSLALPSKQITVTEQWNDYTQSLFDISALMNQSLVSHNKDNNQAISWLSHYNQLTQKYPQMDNCLKLLEACVVRPQFCHRDLSPYNLLFDGQQLLCIDFEYCAASHPLFDLVAVVVTHQLTQQQADELASKYLHQHPNLTENASSLLSEMSHCFWLYAAAWALMMASNNQLPQQQYFDLFNKYLSLVP